MHQNTWNPRCFKNKINNLSLNKTNNLDFLSINFIQVCQHFFDHAFMQFKTMTPWRPCHHIHLFILWLK